MICSLDPSSSSFLDLEYLLDIFYLKNKFIYKILNKKLTIYKVPPSKAPPPDPFG